MTASPDVNLDDLRRRARRRLVGAIVLALAAAVLVPVLLESDPKPLGEDVSVKIPPIDDGKFVNRLNEKARSEPAKAHAPKSEAKSDAVRSEPAKAESPKADNAPETSTKESSASSTSPDVASPPKRSLAEAEQKVLAAPTRPSSAGVSSPSAPAAEPAVPASVAAAPKTTAAATVASAPAATAAGAATPATASETPAASFSVQLAAFSDNYGANALTNKLKKIGYPSYTEPFASTKGTLWRVRVGPFPSREAAASSRDKLKGEGYSGIVAPSK